MATIDVIILMPVFSNLIITLVLYTCVMVFHRKARGPMNDLTQAAETDELSVLHEPARNIDDGERENISRGDSHASTSAPKFTEDLWHFYESIYFEPVPQSVKSGFTINREILQTLRDALRNTRPEPTLTVCIENVFMRHLYTHEELLNEVASAHKRYEALNLWWG